MRRSAPGVVLAVTLLLFAATPTRPAAADVVAEYRTRVLAALDGSTATGIGVAVTVEGHGRVVDVNPSLGLPPASTQKLYTVGAALHRLGPDARLRTEVRRVGTLQPDGTLHGDLVLVAGGDPTVDRKTLYALGNTVGAAGVRRVTGSLWVDDTRYDRVRSGPGWKPHWVPQQSGPLSALSVDRNRWRADGGFLADPVPANATRARTALVWGSVAIAGGTRIGRHPAGPGQLVTARQSPPLAELAHRVLKQSDNFDAELLLKELGARAGSGNGSTAGGIAVVNQVADIWGVPRGSSADGSGLSPHNGQTAATEVAWLEAVAGSAIAQPFRAALPVACGDGTLRRRLCGTAAAGRLVAKTGSLPGVVTLAGYTSTANGKRVTFAVLLAGAGNSGAARAAVDRTAAAIATFPNA